MMPGIVYREEILSTTCHISLWKELVVHFVLWRAAVGLAHDQYHGIMEPGVLTEVLANLFQSISRFQSCVSTFVKGRKNLEHPHVRVQAVKDSDTAELQVL